jgi:predicted nucleotidyltransferase
MKVPAETDFAAVLRLLVTAEVEFIVIGAVSAIAQGLVHTTEDVDVVYSRSAENIHRLTAALAPMAPYLRGAPPGLPFTFDERTVRHGLNFTLTTTLGSVDLLGEVSGGGTYEQLLPFTETRRAFGVEFRTVSLDKLIHLKRAAGRPKDFDLIARLEVLRLERIAAEKAAE